LIYFCVRFIIVNPFYLLVFATESNAEP